MKDWPRQKNLKSLRGFLGLVGYYKKIIRSYGKIATPLKTFLERNAFIWNYFIEWAFQDLKIAMCTTLVLTLPDFTKTFVSECDASSKGIKVVLIQEGQPSNFTRKQLYERHLENAVMKRR